MKRNKVLGLMIGAALLLGDAAIAEATPMAARPSAVEMLCVPQATLARAFLGIGRRHVRRVERRAYRHERRYIRRHGY